MKSATDPLLSVHVPVLPVRHRGLTAATLLESARTTTHADAERETA